VNALAAAGAGFLVAVLWFDLMFDIQARGPADRSVPAPALASISAYYRRVTTEVSPMSRLIPLVMAATVIAISTEIVRSRGTRPADWASVVLAISAIGLALGRTVRNAVRLGAVTDPPDLQGRLARRVLADHLYCLAAMVVVLGLQLFAPV
jgi:hypothetical protein